MAEQITLRAETGRRPGSRESRRLRERGGVPAIVYGKDVESPIPVVVDHRELASALSTEAGANAIITLEVDGQTVLTMPRLVERHPYRNQIRHVDFVTVSLTEKVRAEVGLHLVGEPAGVKEGGVLSQPRGHVTIAAFPAEIPSHIELDVSEMAMQETLRVADLPQMEGVEYLDDPETVVAIITVPRAVVEEEPEAAEGEEGAAPVEPDEVAETEERPDEGEPEA